MSLGSMGRYLVGSGEGGEDQLARIGMSRVDLHLRAALVDLGDLLLIGDVQVRLDALGEHVVCHGQDVHIAGALAVSEQRALHAVRACQQRQFRRRHAGAPVVVGMDGNDHAVAVLEVADHPLHLVRVDVRRIHLHRQRQVHDHRVLRRRHAPLVHHCFADFQREVQLGAHEALRGILEDDVISPEFLHVLLHHLHAVDGDLLDVFL